MSGTRRTAGSPPRATPAWTRRAASTSPSWTATTGSRPATTRELLAAIEELGCDFVRTDHVQCTARARTVHRVPHGRRGVVMNPREAILPADRSHLRGLRVRLGRHLPPPAARRGPAALHRRAAHGRGPAVDLAAAPRGGVLRRGGPARRVLPARGRLLADPDRRRPPARLHPRLRPGDRGDGGRTADADRLLPKAVRTYCAIISHHSRTIERFEPPWPGSCGR